jgi:hypothetical protein
MVTDPALGGATAGVVLNSKSLENSNLAVIENDGKVDDKLPFRLSENGVKAFVEIEIMGGHGKLLSRHVQGVNVLTHAFYNALKPRTRPCV